MNILERTEVYVKAYLLPELREIENSHRKDRLTQLSNFEKAIIYKYTSDGYFSINEFLLKNKGNISSEFGLLLDAALKKLPNFVDVVYRSVLLDQSELKIYNDAFVFDAPVKELTFISTTKSNTIAKQFGGNVLFRINSKTGKQIEEISKFGTDSQNEKEVLFCPNCSFEILGISKEKEFTLITMEELTNDR